MHLVRVAPLSRLQVPLLRTTIREDRRVSCQQVIEASFRGSAQVGWGGRWPFARLVANADTLTLSSLILGTYSFAPSEVIAIEPYGSISTLASAIRIDHNQKNYPKKMIFWCTWGRRSAILKEIGRTGFRPSGQPT